MAENILQQSVEDEITQCYIDYAMSVIVSRALPDVRDWLKPVLRRILFAMNELKLFHNSKFRKSAAVVWEVLWKYHPHWDSSVYEAMVRMAQPFSLRYPLVDGQWNFWSIDWDWAAAMRYTEARLTKIAEEMLQDLELDTVNWRDNYDNSRQEPVTLPTKFPNHLCNGTMWIAVWMATNMAPHNLNEIIDASLLLIEKPEATIDEIMEIVKWPDFPTWWTIFDPLNIKEVYSKWKWSITIRWRSHVEERKWNKVIVIDEIPYQVNKSTLVAKIWELINERRIEWIADITDESNKNIIKIAITLKKWVQAKHMLTLLYKFTDLQTNFNLNNVALIEKWIQPRLLNISELLHEFVDYRKEVVLRRSKFLLKKAIDRLHILEWLKKAIDILDEVIATIRWSDTRQEAKEKLMTNYEFSEQQAEYILMLRLQTLVWLEIQKILEEINEKNELIEYLKWIIEDQNKLNWVVIDELLYIKQEYWDKRRTDISEDLSIYELNSSVKNLKRLEELQKEDVILWIWNSYEVKVLYQTRINIIPDDTYSITYTNNQDKLIVITENWELVIQRLKDLWSHQMKWKAFDFKETFGLNSSIVFSSPIGADFENLLMLTNYNNIKKVKKELITWMKKFPTKIMWLADWEKIIKVIPVRNWDHVWLLSENWIMLVFKSDMVRPSGKTAWWVKWIWLEEWDKISNMFLYNEEMFIFIYSQDSGKLVSMEDCKIQKRAQAWLLVAELQRWQKIIWGKAIDEWAVMIELTSGQVIALDSKNMKLKNRITKLDKITDWKINKVYTPRKDNIQKLNKGEVIVEEDDEIDIKIED